MDTVAGSLDPDKVYSDDPGPIVRNVGGQRTLTTVRRGMASSKDILTERDVIETWIAAPWDDAKRLQLVAGERDLPRKVAGYLAREPEWPTDAGTSIVRNTRSLWKTGPEVVAEEGFEPPT